jgi:hypothetical protein
MNLDVQLFLWHHIIGPKTTIAAGNANLLAAQHRWRQDNDDVR